MADIMLDALLQSAVESTDRDIAARYAPILLFDTHEPFYPIAVGHTVFRHSGPSPSFRQGHIIELAPAEGPASDLAIEYAIWWDWDIGHLYELEHVWVFVDAAGDLVRAQASWHGELHDMRFNGTLRQQDGRPVIYSEPGKHAFAPTPGWFRERNQAFKRSETSELAGSGGVLINRYIEKHVTPTPLKDRLARTYLAGKAFAPSWEFRPFPISAEMLVPWPALAEWMPARVNDWLARLEHEISPASYRFWRIGHRGARAHAPDNTLASFAKAAALGADMVELDVQRTADNQIAVVHDAYLVDAQNHILPVRASTLQELQNVDLGDGQCVPTLRQVLDLCKSEQLGAYIEIKDSAAICDVARIVQEAEWSGHALFGSFRPDWVAEISSLLPQARTSVLFGSTRVDPVQLARSVGASYVHPCWERHPHPSSLLGPDWIGRVRDADLGIICWHEERPAEIAALKQLGLDGICSDAPELLQ